MSNESVHVPDGLTIDGNPYCTIGNVTPEWLDYAAAEAALLDTMPEVQAWFRDGTPISDEDHARIGRKVVAFRAQWQETHR